MTNLKVQQAYAEVKILWHKMCKSMGVDPSSQFVAGIPETAPYYQEYNKAMSLLQAAIVESHSEVR